MIITGIIFGLMLVFYCGYNARTAINMFLQKGKNSSELINRKEKTLSIILPVRNEALNIEKILICLSAQNYPSAFYEVIVVNDHSTDNTGEIVSSLAIHGLNLKMQNLPAGSEGKKAAITLGIQHAKGEIIITTDADCEMGTEWLHTFAQAFDDDCGLISGPVAIKYGNSLFEKLQALEFMGLMTTGAAALNVNQPTLANGANLAYRKSAFLAVGGFEGNEKIASGDDEFLLHKIHAGKKYKCKFLADQNAIVFTKPAQSWKEFRNQRIRWVSKSRAYQRKSITLSLLIIWLGMWSFPVFAVFSLFNPDWLWVLAVSFLLKMCSEGWVLIRAGKFFDNLQLIYWLPLESILHIYYLLWVGIAGNVSQYEWKGRFKS